MKHSAEVRDVAHAVDDKLSFGTKLMWAAPVLTITVRVHHRSLRLHRQPAGADRAGHRRHRRRHEHHAGGDEPAQAGRLPLSSAQRQSEKAKARLVANDTTEIVD
ncbi:hypothetical protein [Virgisporangium aurantiacum]|uniref:Uncharacterized protein n=1 Tax=Virgisporangium aurantiacum TaxID=175570 RepID=A0A8J3ZDW0_9ACTN|nr:hypothetical protein [Virgisporangium aurantiacum]GIJ62159.1 hypothetical protein Vau01_096750 [Virgisporangium aurantiacum]